MTPVPPTPCGSYTPAFGKLECSRSCFARPSARNFISSLLPKCRHPVGHDLMHAGSSPSLTRSVHSVHLKTRLVFGFIFVEENQVPVITPRLRHGLIGIVENGFAERQVVPLHARHFARFAANAGGGVDEFADFIFALRVLAGNGPRVTGNSLDAQYFLAHGILYAFSSFTRKPLNSGV